MNKIITCTAPVNIAVIKYWGKRNEELILPLNDSISFTISQKEMRAKTTVMISPKFSSDRMWLNDKEESVTHSRIANCLREVRRRASKRKRDEENFSSNWHIHICSENNFPTAAGLASSAAGYACLVFALCELLEVKGNISTIARLGSGSACRSLEGGLVRWYKGEAEDGSDSVAEQIASQDQWPDLHVIICIASADRKKTSSTEGMRRSTGTSFFLKCRLQDSVTRRTEEMLKAIKAKDWSSFCDLTMADSNEMHAVCLDTFPPCVYMNDTSHAVAEFVHEYNAQKIRNNQLEEKMCYTFDAGPNACLFVPGKVINEVSSLLIRCFPSSKSTNICNETSYWQGLPLSNTVKLKNFDSLIGRYEYHSHSIKYFLHTEIGCGPQVLDDDDKIHLIDRNTGLPVSLGLENRPQQNL